MDFYSNTTQNAAVEPFETTDSTEQIAETKPLTAEDVAAIVNSALASLRVYVVESDITTAQNSVRAVVEQATF